MTIQNKVKNKAKILGVELIKNTVIALKWTVLSMIIAISLVFAVVAVAKIYEYFI
jgi:hypothetical protein